MGILEALLGRENPLAQFAGNNSNALGAIGAGLAQGPNFSAGLSNAAQLMPNARTLDRTAAAATQGKNATVSYIAAKYPDIADYIKNGGDMQLGWAEALRRDGDASKQTVVSPGDTVLQNGKPVYTAAQKPMGLQGVAPGASLFDPNTNAVLFTNPNATKTEAAPNGYRYGPGGNLQYIPGGPADPSTAGKTTEATRRNQQLASVIVPEVNSLLGDGTKANPGTFDSLANGADQAKALGGGISMGLGLGPSPAYQQAHNSITTIVASYLYSVSGATANPGEVQKQVDVLVPKLGESTESVAAKKLRLQHMVEAVVQAAQGNSFTPQQGLNAGGNTTSSGVQWSITP